MWRKKKIAMASIVSMLVFWYAGLNATTVHAIEPFAVSDAKITMACRDRMIAQTIFTIQLLQRSIAQGDSVHVTERVSLGQELELLHTFMMNIPSNDDTLFCQDAQQYLMMRNTHMNVMPNGQLLPTPPNVQVPSSHILKGLEKEENGFDDIATFMPTQHQIEQFIAEGAMFFDKIQMFPSQTMHNIDNKLIRVVPHAHKPEIIPKFSP